MAQQPFSIKQGTFTGGIVSEASEALVTQENLAHCHEIKNFYIDGNGKLNKRKGAVFAVSQNNSNVTHTIPFSDDEAIVNTEVIDTTAETVIIAYYVGSISAPETSLKIYTITFEFTHEAPFLRVTHVDITQDDFEEV